MAGRPGRVPGPRRDRPVRAPDRRPAQRRGPDARSSAPGRSPPPDCRSASSGCSPSRRPCSWAGSSSRRWWARRSTGRSCDRSSGPSRPTDPRQPTGHSRPPEVGLADLFVVRLVSLLPFALGVAIGGARLGQVGYQELILPSDSTTPFVVRASSRRHRRSSRCSWRAGWSVSSSAPSRCGSRSSTAGPRAGRWPAPWAGSFAIRSVRSGCSQRRSSSASSRSPRRSSPGLRPGRPCARRSSVATTPLTAVSSVALFVARLACRDWASPGSSRHGAAPPGVLP